MSERLLPSDPRFEEINRLQGMLVILANVRIAKQREKGFVAGQLLEVDIGEAELLALETKVTNALDGKLDEVQKESLEEVWGEFVGGLK